MTDISLKYKIAMSFTVHMHMGGTEGGGGERQMAKVELDFFSAVCNNDSVGGVCATCIALTHSRT